MNKTQSTILHAEHHTNDDYTACGLRMRDMTNDRLAVVPTCRRCRSALTKFWKGKN